jgi:hypothetical protein
MTLLPFVAMEIAFEVNLLITRPRTVLLPAVMFNPFERLFEPFNSTIGAPENPGCVVPSMTTGTVIIGSADVGANVTAPEPTANLIVLVNPVFRFEFRIACRSVPGPLSAVLVTLNVRGPALVTATQAENSDVLPFGSVAVAVMYSPTTDAPGTEMLPDELPLASVVTSANPR